MALVHRWRDYKHADAQRTMCSHLLEGMHRISSRVHGACDEASGFPAARSRKEGFAYLGFGCQDSDSPSRSTTSIGDEATKVRASAWLEHLEMLCQVAPRSSEGTTKHCASVQREAARSTNARSVAIVDRLLPSSSGGSALPLRSGSHVDGICNASSLVDLAGSSIRLETPLGSSDYSQSSIS